MHPDSAAALTSQVNDMTLHLADYCQMRDALEPYAGTENMVAGILHEFERRGLTPK